MKHMITFEKVREIAESTIEEKVPDIVQEIIDSGEHIYQHEIKIFVENAKLIKNIIDENGSSFSVTDLSTTQNITLQILTTKKDAITSTANVMTYSSSGFKTHLTYVQYHPEILANSVRSMTRIIPDSGINLRCFLWDEEGEAGTHADELKLVQLCLVCTFVHVVSDTVTKII